MGSDALKLLKSGLSPSNTMSEAMIAICDAAVAKDVKLLPAAEQQYAQSQVDRWTLDLAAKYNRLRPGHAVLYNTYQVGTTNGRHLFTITEITLLTRARRHI